MEKTVSKRDQFKSNIGFLLVSAGCAIGIGNVWRFPYVVGSNGGGFFVLLYLIFLVALGIPVLTMELAVGRASRKGCLESFVTLEKPNHKWHLHGWVSIAGCILLMMYYTSVAGWMVGYFFKFLTGTFSGMATDNVVNEFANLQADPLLMILLMAVVVIAGFLVCSFSVQKGLERINKIMMVCLLGLIVVLAIHSLSLEGAMEGLKFYLLPNVEAAMEVGIGKVIVAAMNQAFFTLSIGIGSMEIFGSYMSKDNTLLKESSRICVLDTFVAIVSGLIIFPACFAFGTRPDAGPPLIFITLPKVFVNMPLGSVWGALFFLFMIFASFSTVTAVFESIMAFFMEKYNWSRKKTALICCCAILVLSIPCVLGFNVWKDFTVLGGKNILDLEDFIVSNLLLPIGCLVYLLFCVSKFGWGFDKYLEECNTGKGMRFAKWVKPYLQFVLPVIIVIILVSGLVSL